MDSGGPSGARRQIVLDTETTGLEADRGDRVVEIGCVELRERRSTGNNFHRYVNPERDVGAAAVAIHGLTNERLAQEAVFAQLAPGLWDYLKGAELIIHNAAFDVGFLDHEFARAGITQRLEDVCAITDTVEMARRLHPGRRLSLDALCRRYNVDNSGRDLHGALLDAQLLAEVYLAMTGGQVSLSLMRASVASGPAGTDAADAGGGTLPVIHATAVEREAHRARLRAIREKAGQCLWETDLIDP